MEDDTVIQRYRHVSGCRGHPTESSGRRAKTTLQTSYHIMVIEQRYILEGLAPSKTEENVASSTTAGEGILWWHQQLPEVLPSPTEKLDWYTGSVSTSSGSCAGLMEGEGGSSWRVTTNQESRNRKVSQAGTSEKKEQ
jgi:hypothetical protein